MDRARKEATAPSQPTDDVTCAVSASFRTPGDMIICGDPSAIRGRQRHGNEVCRVDTIDSRRGRVIPEAAASQMQNHEDHEQKGRQDPRDRYPAWRALVWGIVIGMGVWFRSHDGFMNVNVKIP